MLDKKEVEEGTSADNGPSVVKPAMEMGATLVGTVQYARTG